MKKIVLITGGSRGIGAATVRQFNQHGYTVLFAYNNSALAAKQLTDELNANGGDVHALHCNLANPDEIDGMFETIATYYKHIDVLVNNAGVSVTGLMQDLSVATFDNLWAVNARAPYLCCKAALSLLALSDSPSVVNVSSVWGLHGASCETAYGMTKHAVVGLTRSLAEEWSGCGIAVNCVCPPIVDTDMCAHLSDDDKQVFCTENNCCVYTAEQVAEDIFRLATSGETGVIKEEK